MDQTINIIKNTAGKCSPAVLLFTLLLFGCEKKPKTIIHSDIFEAEINGTKYEFTKLSYGGTVGQVFFLEGKHKGQNGINSRLDISLCNLSNWPSTKTFPLIKEYCNGLSLESTYAQYYLSQGFSSSRYLNDSIPNPHTSVTFEKFEAIDGNNYEFKGTFKMALARSDEQNPLSLPDSCFITGRFHLKRPTRTTVD